MGTFYQSPSLPLAAPSHLATASFFPVPQSSFLFCLFAYLLFSSHI